jgi:hypothetical protein
MAAGLLAVTTPGAAAAHSLSLDAVNRVVFNTVIADDWDCHPVTSHRADCERGSFNDEEDDDGCHDLVAFFLVGATLDWRFYRNGCATGFAEHPRWAAALEPVPWTLLYDGWTTGSTSQGRPVSFYLFRQFHDNGKFAVGSVDDAWVTVRLACTDGRARQRTYHPYWGTRFGGSRTIRARSISAGARVVLNGRVEGRARTGIRGTLRVSQALGHGVSCRSRVHFAAAAHRLDLF